LVNGRRPSSLSASTCRTTKSGARHDHRQNGRVARPHIEFIRAQDVSESDPAEPFRGARERRLSTDDETGAYTSVMAFADGWSGDLSGGARPIEIFVLRGEIELGGRCLAPGCYVYLESGVAAAKLDALTGALALVMVNDERPASPTRAWEIVDTEQMPFEPSNVVGLVIKKLRVDPETGEWTWLAGSAPNRVTPHAEVHPTVEEAFLIRSFESIDEHAEQEARFYSSREWHDGPRAAILECIESYHSVVIDAGALSGISDTKSL